MQKEEKVRVDLHVHVDGKLTKENVIKCLIKAEQDKVQKLCLLEHCHLNVLKPIVEVLKEGSLRKYYSGELIIGCEYDTMIDAHHKNKDGTNYDGFISHILSYYTLEDAIKLYKNKILHNRNGKKDYKRDYKKLIKKLDELDPSCEKPTLKELCSIGEPHIVKDLRIWICRDANRKEKFKKLLNIDESILDYPSNFIRTQSQDPKGLLFYKPDFVPYSSELFKIIRKTAKSAKIVLAHPAYMHTVFTKENYLETMMSYEGNVGAKTFDGIEVCYYFNTKAEQDYLEKYANKRGFIKTAGSDSIKVDGEMYFIRDGKKYFFVPELGNALGTSYDIGNVKITKQGDKNIIETKNGGSPLVVNKNLFEEIKVDDKKAFEMLKKVKL